MAEIEAQRAIRNRARLRAQADPSLINHGTTSGYTYWKCRCTECRAAKAGRPIQNKGR